MVVPKYCTSVSGEDFEKVLALQTNSSLSFMVYDYIICYSSFRRFTSNGCIYAECRFCLVNWFSTLREPSKFWKIRLCPEERPVRF